MLSFLSPWFLLGAIAVAVPILLHLFRRKTEIVIDFPAVRLLRRAPVEQRKRRRLRELILLALRVTALLLLAAAFARPYLAGRADVFVAPVTVVAIDTSLSLSAPGQWARARDAARQAVSDAPATHTVAVIAFADSATVVSAPSIDRGALQAAIDGLAPTPAGTRYRTALARATELVGSREGEVVIVTDLQQAGWDANDEGGLPDRVAVRMITVPPPRGNLSVTLAERRGAVVVGAVHNYGAMAARTLVTLRADGAPIGSQSLEIAPQSAAEVRFATAVPARGAGEIVVDDREGYALDNARFLLFDPPAPLPIAVVVADPGGTRAGLYVERALSVAQGGREFAVEVVDGRTVSAWTAERASSRAAIVVLGTRTLDRRGRELIAGYLQNGGPVLLALGPDVDPGTLGDVLGQAFAVSPEPVDAPAGGATLVASDTRHPVLRAFLNPSGALGDVSIIRYRRLTDQPGRAVLARLSGGAVALAEQTAGQGRLIVFASDLDNQWSRFPLVPAFVPFTIETARYLTAGRRERQQWVLPETPAGAPPRPGVVAVGNRRAVVNIDVRESNPAATTVEEFQAGIARLSGGAADRASIEARGLEDRQRLWQVGLALMLVALAAEGIVGRRAN
jgi:hypothetical protein